MILPNSFLTKNRAQNQFPNLPGYGGVGGGGSTTNTKQSLHYVNGFMMVDSRSTVPGGGLPGRPGTAAGNMYGGGGGSAGGGFNDGASVTSQLTIGSSITTAAIPRDAVHPSDVSGRYSLTRQKWDRESKALISSSLLPRPNTSTGVGRLAPPSTASIRLSHTPLPTYTPHLPEESPLPIVLLFTSYFYEDITESQIENKRVNRCEIYYYSGEDSFEIITIKQSNSGIPQGSILSKRKIPGLKITDFQIGNKVNIFARDYHIVGANNTTKKHMAERYGHPESSDLPWPNDRFTTLNYNKMIRETGFGGATGEISRNRKKHEMKSYMEAVLGKPQSLSDLGSFLQHNNKTLSFEVLWDDTNRLYGEVRFFKLFYFLSDDTMEILPIHYKNDGRDQFPKLLKRSKVPVDPSKPLGECFTWKDFSIGKSLNIFSRQMVLFRSDEFTKRYYASQGVPLGPDFDYVDNDSLVSNERQIPPYNGFGSEEDSLRSCTGGIKPTPPKKEFHWDKRGFVLRFNAKLVSTRVEDKGRRFVLQFFLEDDTLAIREPPIRNSGVVGGNFLRRQSLKNGDGVKYGPRDFYVGAVCNINCHKFVLLDADEYTYRLMENDVRTFPLSNFEPIVPGLQSNAEGIRQFFLKSFEGDHITFADLESCLNNYCGMKLRKQQLITIWRVLDKKNRGNVMFSKLIKLAENGTLSNVSIARGF
jgi:hypothetical protein